jgi:hypothetical protein
MEKVRFLRLGQKYAGMLGEVIIEGRGPRLRGAYDQEIRSSAYHASRVSSESLQFPTSARGERNTSTFLTRILDVRYRLDSLAFRAPASFSNQRKRGNNLPYNRPRCTVIPSFPDRRDFESILHRGPRSSPNPENPHGPSTLVRFTAHLEDAHLNYLMIARSPGDFSPYCKAGIVDYRRTMNVK